MDRRRFLQAVGATGDGDHDGARGLQHARRRWHAERRARESSEEDSAFSGLRGFSDLDLSGNALGATVSATFSQDENESAIAIRYESEDEVDAKEDIEAALGDQADDRSVTVDGQMAYVEGAYTEDSSGS